MPAVPTALQLRLCCAGTVNYKGDQYKKPDIEDKEEKLRELAASMGIDDFQMPQ